MVSHGKLFCPTNFSRFMALFLSVAVLSGCAGPIGVTRVSPQESYNLNTENSLGDGIISDSSKAILQRYNLIDAQTEKPFETIQALHVISKSDDRRDILFTLSELCYLHGQELTKKYNDNNHREAQDVFLQSAVYAYFYLLGDGREAAPECL
jgi:hypothetical protein